jgi:hypothetical protein
VVKWGTWWGAKSQIPNPKSQTNSNHQRSKFKTAKSFVSVIWYLIFLGLFGIWGLGFGIFALLTVG